MSHERSGIPHLTTSFAPGTIPNGGFFNFTSPALGAKDVIVLDPVTIRLKAGHTYLVEALVHSLGGNGVTRWTDTAGAPIGLVNHPWTTATGLNNHHGHPFAIVVAAVDTDIRLQNLAGGNAAAQALDTVYIREIGL